MINPDDLMEFAVLAIVSSNDLKHPSATVQLGANHTMFLVQIKGLFLLPRRPDGFPDVSKLPTEEEKTKMSTLSQLSDALVSKGVKRIEV